MKKNLIPAFFFIICHTVLLNAQEIPRGFILPFEIGQGFISSEYSPPEIYLAAVTIKPSYSIAKNKVRIGAIGMMSYTDGLVSYSGGPRLAVKIYQSRLGMFGEIFNIQLTGDAQWGTRDLQLYGGGVTFEADPAVLSFDARQVYNTKEFWFDVSAGLNLDRIFCSKKHEDDDPFK